MNASMPLVAAVAIICATSAHAETLNVPGDYPTIQEAIDAASDGDDVLVAPGNHTSHFNFLGKAITVHSSGGRDVTTITGQVTFNSFESSASRLEGFGLYFSTAVILEFSNPTIVDCKFVAFTRGISAVGSASQITDCAFTTSMSSAIDCNASGLVITDCTFTGNTASRGGALHAFNFSIVTLTGCLFDGNEANSEGGAIHLSSNSLLTATDCTFQGNEAGNGGGAIYSNQTLLTLTDCTFIGNVATPGDNDGGAVLTSGGEAVFTRCHFESNEADWGGAVYNTTSNAIYDTCTFTKNIADGRGGGICFANSSAPHLVACLFEQNTAFDGGGVYFVSISNATMEVCAFTSNLATGHGGAVLTSSGSQSVTDCMFTGNRALINGGAVYQQNTGTVHFTNCDFTGNLAVLGSGIYNRSVGSSSSIVGCTFIENVTGVSGGIYNSNSDVQITNCVLDGNTAAAFGGGVFNFSNSDPTITGCEFSRNTATMGAGIFSFNDGSSAAVGTSDFCGNDPDDIGGDWIDNGGNTFMVECKGDGCPADLDGNDVVDFGDIILILTAWGPCEACPEDLDDSGSVDFGDILVVLTAWGPCE